MTTAPPSKSRKSTKAKTRRKSRKAQTGSRPETIRDILFTKFPRVHSSEEVLASQRTFVPPLTQLTPIGSKQSRRLTGDDQDGHPLDNTLVSWQGAMPCYHLMHLAHHLRMRNHIHRQPLHPLRRFHCETRRAWRQNFGWPLVLVHCSSRGIRCLGKNDGA
ncbi:hypothetical protein CPB85DRAFT_459523 [Mucidula mucida]|nr:hypothetical protein CPB85DRAFT_459523 [Mucidula mucida]